MKMIELIARSPRPSAASWSSVMPFVLVNVCQSRLARITSSYRDSAQNPYRSLKYTGRSSRSQRYVSYGSSKKSAESGSNSITTSIGASSPRARSDAGGVDVFVRRHCHLATDELVGLGRRQQIGVRHPRVPARAVAHVADGDAPLGPAVAPVHHRVGGDGRGTRERVR